MQKYGWPNTLNIAFDGQFPDLIITSSSSCQLEFWGKVGRLENNYQVLLMLESSDKLLSFDAIASWRTAVAEATFVSCTFEQASMQGWQLSSVEFSVAEVLAPIVSE